MASLSTVEWHLEIKEIHRRYRQCECPVEKSYWHIIWLRAQGKKTGEVARVTGFNTAWVRRLVRRYNSVGPETIRDHRKKNGRAPLLSAEQQMELLQTLMRPAPDGGLWNSPKVARWMAQKLGRPVRSNRGLVYLHKLGMTLKTPRPHNARASKEAQNEFKKNSRRSWQMSRTSALRPK